MKGAVHRPINPAVIAKTEMRLPNCWGVRERSRMSCGPSGIITMKSMMCVNWTAASSSSRRVSERIRGLGATGEIVSDSLINGFAPNGAGRGNSPLYRQNQGYDHQNRSRDLPNEQAARFPLADDPQERDGHHAPGAVGHV